jgi:hypothetical protein
MTWADWNDEPVDWGCWLFAGLALVATAFMCCGCSSRPELELPADAGAEASLCDECWAACGNPKCPESECRGAVTMCTFACAWICQEEGR